MNRTDDTLSRVTNFEKSLFDKQNSYSLPKISKNVDNAHHISKLKLNDKGLGFGYYEILKGVDNISNTQRLYTSSNYSELANYNFLVKLHLLKLDKVDNNYAYYKITSTGKKVLMMINKRARSQDKKHKQYFILESILMTLTWLIVILDIIVPCYFGLIAEIVIGLMAFVPLVVWGYFFERNPGTVIKYISEKSCLPILKHTLSSHDFYISLKLFRNKEI